MSCVWLACGSGGQGGAGWRWEVERRGGGTSIFEVGKKKMRREFPLWLSGLRTGLVSMRRQV